MGKRTRLTEASKLVFESSSDDDASSGSRYLSDSKDYSGTSESESEDTLPEVQQFGGIDDEVASRDLPQNNPQSNDVRNSFIWYQPTAFFTPKFPNHD